MENQGKSLNENALYFGVLTGLALIIYSLVLYIFNQSANQTLGYFSLIFMAIGVFLAAKIFRDQSQEGFITYGRALGVSILTAFYASLLLAVYMYVFYKFIDPEAIKPMLDAAEQEMYRQGIEGQELDMALSMTEKFMKPGWMAGMAVLSNTFWGTVIALITSIFVKKEQKI